MTGTRSSGRSHAALESAVRLDKARRIERLLGLDGPGPDLRILEIGTGSGWMAHYFAMLGVRRHAVTSVDVVDERQQTQGYLFQQITGGELPFDDSTFDVVISNHVIEHVGVEAEQLQHLRECRRLMAVGGSGYLATPNRWMLKEPHYQVYLLSWLPRGWRSRYLRLLRVADGYDCEPLTRRRLERLLEQAGLVSKNISVDVLRDLAASEGRTGRLIRLLARAPDRCLHGLRGLIPTLIYRLQRPAGVD